MPLNATTAAQVRPIIRGNAADPTNAKMAQLGQNCDAWNLALQSRFTGTKGCFRCEVGAVGERKKLLSKLDRFLTIRNRISDGLAATVVEELIKETEERLAQIENNVPDQKALRPTSREVPE